MKVAKWGDRLAIPIPADIAEALNLKEGDDIEVRVAGQGIVEVERAPELEELLARVRKLRGRLPPDWKFDRLEANERG